MTTNRVERPWHQKLYAITGRQRLVYQTIITEDLHVMMRSKVNLLVHVQIQVFKMSFLKKPIVRSWTLPELIAQR